MSRVLTGARGAGAKPQDGINLQATRGTLPCCNICAIIFAFRAARICPRRCPSGVGDRKLSYTRGRRRSDGTGPRRSSLGRRCDRERDFAWRRLLERLLRRFALDLLLDSPRFGEPFSRKTPAPRCKICCASLTTLSPPIVCIADDVDALVAVLLLAPAAVGNLRL